MKKDERKLKPVHVKFTGGFAAGDHEMKREGFRIGAVYPGYLDASKGVVWVQLFMRSGAEYGAMYLNENCELFDWKNKTKGDSK